MHGTFYILLLLLYADEEGLSVGAIAAISAGSAIVIFIAAFEVTVTIAGSVVLHLEIKQIKVKISKGNCLELHVLTLYVYLMLFFILGGEVKHYISCTKRALFYMSPVGFYYCYYKSSKYCMHVSAASGTAMYVCRYIQPEVSCVTKCGARSGSSQYYAQMLDCFLVLAIAFENCPDILKVDWCVKIWVFCPDVGQFVSGFCQVKDCYCELCVLILAHLCNM